MRRRSLSVRRGVAIAPIDTSSSARVQNTEDCRDDTRSKEDIDKLFVAHTPSPSGTGVLGVSNADKN